MHNIFLSLSELRTPLILEPKKDTVYFLPQEIETAVLNLNLTIPDVRAFVVGLFHTDTKTDITIHQNHLAPNTGSHVLLKTLVSPTGDFRYQGNIRIERTADGSNASQEARGLLQGEGARFKAIPSLEILPKNVICTHKASSSPVNKDSVYTLQTKGFSDEDAKTLLETAFLKGAFDVLTGWEIPEATMLLCEEKLLNNQ